MAEARIRRRQNAHISLQETILDPKLDHIQKARTHDHDQQKLRERVPMQRMEQKISESAQRDCRGDQHGDNDRLREDDDQ